MNQRSEDPPSVQADKRKSLRSPLLVLKVRIDEGSKAFFGYAKNISRSGMFIGTANPRETGERFEVEFSLPEPLRTTLRCTCEVVWKRHYARKSPYEPGMGLRFLDLDDQAAEQIDAWVKSRQV